MNHRQYRFRTITAWTIVALATAITSVGALVVLAAWWGFDRAL